jgi:glycosyltransferase involved in cell wall biosynthesis
LRILVLCGGSYVFGKEIMTLSVLRGLKARGHTIRCVTNSWNDGDFHKRLEAADIPYKAIPVGMISKRLSPKYIKWTLDALVHLPKAWWDYRQISQTWPHDLVLSTGFGTVSMLRFMIDPSKTVHYVHELESGSIHTRRVIQSSSNGGIAYIAPSQHIEARLQKAGVPASKTYVVHNGIELESFGLTREDIRSGEIAPTHTSGHIDIGIVGQVEAWKGHLDLMKALHLLSETTTTYTCHIVGRGKGAHRKEVESYNQRHGLGDNVIWHGFRDDIEAVYRDLDILVVPSRHGEPFGLVAAEAGLFGIPVVATRNGGLPEIVIDGETGFLVDAGSPKQIADWLEQLIGSPSLRTQMGKQAQQRVLAHFTHERVIDGVEEVLQSVVK